MTEINAGDGDGLKEAIDTACYVAGLGSIIGLFTPAAPIAAAVIGYCAGYGGGRLFID